jgi:hypothetical protein
VPTLTLQGINGDSAGNYQLMDEESTGLLPEITESFSIVEMFSSPASSKLNSMQSEISEPESIYLQQLYIGLEQVF